MCSDFTLRARRAMRSVCAAATCGRAARGRRGGGEDAGGRARREEAGVGGLALGTPAVRAGARLGGTRPSGRLLVGGGASFGKCGVHATHGFLLVISALRDKCPPGPVFARFLHLILGVGLCLWEVWQRRTQGSGRW